MCTQHSTLQLPRPSLVFTRTHTRVMRLNNRIDTGVGTRAGGSAGLGTGLARPFRSSHRSRGTGAVPRGQDITMYDAHLACYPSNLKHGVLATPKHAQHTRLLSSTCTIIKRKQRCTMLRQ
eukprot:TRINITY_DN14745_c0_g1_i1.p1 TRINITY_DN14745_c0_g1~~TRINITY_DN14745_c0_g1_i1.p1  ORF type:complete len:121 (-),score=0.04 TRINITY_DN14745_c0_g1_i1:312-674(-)